MQAEGRLPRDQRFIVVFHVNNFLRQNCTGEFHLVRQLIHRIRFSNDILKECIVTRLEIDAIHHKCR